MTRHRGATVVCECVVWPIQYTPSSRLGSGPTRSQSNTRQLTDSTPSFFARPMPRLVRRRRPALPKTLVRQHVEPRQQLSQFVERHRPRLELCPVDALEQRDRERLHRGRLTISGNCLSVCTACLALMPAPRVFSARDWPLIEVIRPRTQTNLARVVDRPALRDLTARVAAPPHDQVHVVRLADRRVVHPPVRSLLGVRSACTRPDEARPELVMLDRPAPHGLCQDVSTHPLEQLGRTVGWHS